MLNTNNKNNLTEQRNPLSQKKGVIPFLVGVVVLVGVAVFLLATSPFSILKKTDIGGYVIPNVPPLSAYDEEMFAWRMLDSRKAYTVAVLRYWGEDMKLTEELYTRLLTTFPATSLFPRVGNFVGEYGYDAEVRQLETPEKLRKFINEDARTPLLFHQLTDPNIPTSGTFKILVGLKDDGRTVVVHDYFLGPAIEMAWNDFEELWQKTRDAGWGYHRYLIIQPVDEVKRRAVSERGVVSYTPVSDRLSQFQPLLIRIMVLSREGNEARVNALTTELLEHPLFEKLHPYLKVRAHSEIAVRKWRFGKPDEALLHLEKAEALNHDLNAQYGSWPQYYADKDYFSTTRLGRYYREVGDGKKSEALFAEARILRSTWLETLANASF